MKCDSTLFYANYASGKKYCLTVVTADGLSSSIVFDRNLNITSTQNNSHVILSTLELGSGYHKSRYESGGTRYNSEYAYGISIAPQSGKTPEIIYMELVEGTEPQFYYMWLRW